MTAPAGPAGPGTSGASGAVRRIAAVAHRHVILLRRSPHRLFDVTLLPLVDTLLFGSLSVFVSQQSGGGGGGQVAASYLLTGIVLWHVLYQAQISVSAGVLEEIWSRNLFSLMVTPLREVEFVAGVVLVGVMKLVLGVTGVAVAGLLLYAFHITALGFGLLPVAVLLLVSGWMIGLVVVGLVLRFGAGAESLAWGLMFVVMPLSGVLYPVHALPGFLQPVSAVLPTTHAFAAGRALLSSNRLPVGELGAAAVAAAVLSAVALAFVTWMLRLFRSRGYVTRHM